MGGTVVTLMLLVMAWLMLDLYRRARESGKQEESLTSSEESASSSAASSEEDSVLGESEGEISLGEEIEIQESQYKPKPKPEPAASVPHHISGKDAKSGALRQKIGFGPRGDTSKAEFHAYWELWCQGASKYAKMRKGGCRVVAQTKLLVEAGMASPDVSRFNPDKYLEWASGTYFLKGQSVDEYYAEDVNTGEVLMTGAGIVAWGKEQGFRVVQRKEYLSGNQAEDEALIMKRLREGAFCILTSDAHHAYVGRTVSLEAGRPYLLDSQTDCAYNWSMICTLDNYPFCEFECLYSYTVTKR